MSAPIVERLLFCADVGDMGRKPDLADVYRVAAATITDLLAALERIEAQALCVALRHDKDEADDWLYVIANQARAEITKAKGSAA